ncbi:MAG: sulfatase [Planctomycetes bacterium]|nr:sulfatase [Planctomycetota bacterium]MBI3845727.1 sulfatase [Planctomycetota bacterium]
MFALALFSGACTRLPGRSPGANVVLVSIDTLRAGALGCFGETRPTSPALDSFASEALVFRRAYSQAGLTAPSHMSLMTSLYPTVHKVSNSNRGLKKPAQANGDKIARRRLSSGVPTLASCLRAAGYRTGAFVGGGNVNSEIGFDQGFEIMDDDAKRGTNGNQENDFDPSHAMAWVEAHRNEKFFLFLHTYIPHAPYLPPPPWDRAFDPDYTGAIASNRLAFYAEPSASSQERIDRYWKPVNVKDPRDVAHLRALYAGDVRYADDSIAQVFAELRRLGVWDRSIVVVVSDHGEEFLEHGKFQHSGELYEELVHVPLLIRFPNPIPRSIEQPVRLLDVMPTVLDCVDAPIPREAQGRSLLACLEGPLAPVPIVSETVLRWEAPPGDDALAWKPVDLYRAVRDGGFTYLQRIVAAKIRREELYDDATDPAERHDLASDSAQKARLVRLRKFVYGHEEECRRLAEQYDQNGAKRVFLSGKQEEALEALGYAK